MPETPLQSDQGDQEEKEVLKKPKVLIFASGTSSPETGGGSGFKALVEAAREGVFNAEIVAVVTNHENGSVANLAAALGVPLKYYARSYTPEVCEELKREFGAEYFILSGFLKKVEGDASSMVNVHPADTKKFGGKGMYGLNIHTKVLEAYAKGDITESQLTIHFATEKYDEGPVICRIKLPLEGVNPPYTPETLQEEMKEIEHFYYPRVLDLVVHKKISWDGEDPNSLKLPPDYDDLLKAWEQERLHGKQ